MDGVLVVDKPSGPTSHDVVARARRALKTKRIGHTGTLDPLATGVLPLVIGRATRLASYLTAGEKSYEAGVRLGCATETYDAAERIAAGIAPPAVPAISSAEVEAALQHFRGAYLQAPPPYSAKKIGGVAAYRLARGNRPAQPAPVPVAVTELRLTSLEAGLAALTVTASAGFYVRSLAHELGRVLGCGAHLESLRRTRAGGFTLDGALSLEALESLGVQSAARLVPLEALLPEIPAVVLNASGERRTRHGNDVRPEDLVTGADLRPAAGSPVRLLGADRRLLAMARAGGAGVLRPSVVLV